MLKKGNLIALLGTLLLGFISAGCSVQPNGNAPESKPAVNDQVQRGISYVGKIPIGGFNSGTYKWFPGEEAYLLKEYNRWKSKYVAGPGSPGSPSSPFANASLRIQTDPSTSYDTKSEGIGYGMLLALYFGDDSTFWALNQYRIDHNNKNGLMHWRQDSQGNNIDEFGQLVYASGDSRNNRTIVNAWTGQSYSTIKIDQFNTWGVSRSLTSAADADLDMAAALVLMYYRQSALGQSYSYDALMQARALIYAILKCDIKKCYDSGSFNGHYYVVAGAGDWNTDGSAYWGGNTSWNPSYITLAWFQLFAKFMGEAVNDSAAANQLKSIYWDTMNLLHAMYNTFGGIGLFPDWVDSSMKISSLEFIQPHGYMSAGADTWTAAENTALSGRGWVAPFAGPGLQNQSDRGPSSFNFYYDAVRVPWRLALDRSWYGPNNPYSADVENIILNAEANFIKNRTTYDIGYDLYSLKDGYDVSGNPWSFSYADWNNTNDDSKWGQLNALGQYITKGGINNPSTTFMSMMSCPFQATGDYDSAFKAYQYVKYNTDYAQTKYNYFGNACRILSLLYLSGNMKNYSTCTWISTGTGLNVYAATNWDSTGKVNTVTIQLQNNTRQWAIGPTLTVRYYIDLSACNQNDIQLISRGWGDTYFTTQLVTKPNSTSTISKVYVYDPDKKIGHIDITINPIPYAAWLINPGDTVTFQFKYTLNSGKLTAGVMKNYSDVGLASTANYTTRIPVYMYDSSHEYNISTGTEPPLQ